MNNYFITKRDLDEDREHVLNAVSKCICDLRNEILLILDSLGYKIHPAKEIKKGDKMSGKKIKALMERLWLVADKLDNEELVSIAKELEEYVEKTSGNLKKFNEELKGLLERVRVLEEKRE